MATSGSTTFNLTANEIIRESFDVLEMGIEGEDETSESFQRAIRSLNMMLATWQGQEIHLWTYTEVTLFLEAGVSSYILENVQATNREIRTALTTAAVDTDTTVTLDSVSELADTWSIGILKDDNNFFWTTVNGAPVGNVVTLTDALDGDAAADNVVYYYETGVAPVERVLNIRRVNGFTNDTPVQQVSHQEFFDLPSKESEGSVSEAYYDRQRDNGVLHIWATPANSLELMRLTTERRLEDFVATDDDPDIPKYWLEALIYNLALRLATKFRVPEAIYNRVEKMAENTLSIALSFDVEITDLSVAMDRQVR